MLPSPAASPARFMVIACGDDPGFRTAAAAAIADLTASAGWTVLCASQPQPQHPPSGTLYRETLTRVGGHLTRALPFAELYLTYPDRLADVPAAAEELLAAANRDVIADDPIPLLLLARHAPRPDDGPGSLERELSRTVALLPRQLRRPTSHYTCTVYTDRDQSTVFHAPPFALRAPGDDPELWATDILATITDFADAQLAAARHRDQTTALAVWLHAFMTARAGTSWGLHSYTGSVVSSVIHDLERLTRGSGNPIVRSPNEHGLAAGAMARALLADTPYLIVVTSGMIDEFRGTLANLAYAQARGLLVCADASGHGWFPFQGTVHGHEDAREVLRARGIPVIHLERPELLADDLAAAAHAYDAATGPVVLLTTPAVLETPTTAHPPLPIPQPPTSTGAITLRQRPFQAVLDLLESGPPRVLCQAGPLGTLERGLLHQLARDCGIALSDSPARPGTVCKYPDGKPCPEYLGTLGLHGTSAAVTNFLHRRGTLRGKDEQCLIFMASRIAQIATPFTRHTLEHRLQVVQVTRDSSHLAPFADLPLQTELRPLLTWLAERVRTPTDLLSARRAAIVEATSAQPDLTTRTPTRPMTPPYFFARLNGLIETLVAQDAYRYTGVYDVGRAAASAIRNLTRTGPGLSGWYGRSLMGDALSGIPAMVATLGDNNILAFVGDGAANLVPDILPTLIQQICLDGPKMNGNLSIFRLINGSHSLIRTYQEVRRGTTSDGQSVVLSLIDDNWTRSYGLLTVNHVRINDIDLEIEHLAKALQEPSTINLYSVLLSHTNEGDGMPAIAGAGWRG